MNKNISRGLVLVAITGAFTFLGATTASAIDLDLGGDDDSDVLDILRVPVEGNAPVNVNGLNVSVLDGSSAGTLFESDDVAPLLGNGILVNPGATGTDALADLRVDSTDVLDNDTQTFLVGVPVDASYSWATVFGANGGVVVVPNLTADPSAVTNGIVDGDVIAPVVIDCTTVTVLSDYESDCAGDATDPTDPTDPGTPTDPTNPATPGEVGNGGVGDNGAVGGNDGAVGDGGNDGDVCVAGTTPTAGTSDVNPSLGLGVLGSTIAGVLATIAVMKLGRKFTTL